MEIGSKLIDSMCFGIAIHRTKQFVASLMLSAAPLLCNAQENELTENGFSGLDDLTGCTFEQLKENITADQVYSTDDMSKIFFIYNVKTGKFLRAGSYWGTHVSMKDVPLPLWTKSATNSSCVNFAQDLTTGQGHYLKWAEGSNSTTDYGIYIDRSRNDSYGYDGWFFEPVTDAEDASIAKKNTYRLYTYKKSTYTSSDDKYYLCVNGDQIDQDKNCGAATMTRIETDGNVGYETWRIFSMQQIYDLQEKNLDNMTSSLEISFKLKCPGFARGDNNIGEWKTYAWGAGTDAKVRFGLEQLYDSPKVSVGGSVASVDRGGSDYDYIGDFTNYTFTHDNNNDRTFSDKADYQRHMGKYFCADARNVRGTIYQDVKVNHAGTYVIECKAYSTTPQAKLFAGLVDPTNSKNTLTETLRQTVLSQVAYMPETEQEALHTSEMNMDYAGKEFYGSRKYINSVIVRVPSDVAEEERIIRFGIMIGDADNTTPESGEWTVFDDFRLLFANKETDDDLILDEDRDNLDYLTYATNYRNKTLHLNKSFGKDMWNSLVLPVDLTVDQFRQAFGANARIAELTALTNNEIQFKTKEIADDKTETGNGSKVILEAYKPYIIFPTKDLTKETNPVYKSHVTETSTGGSEKHIITVKANHIDISNVSMKTNDNNENDLSNMDTDTWTSKLNTAGDGTITAYATFARTFGQATQDETTGIYTISNKSQIISGRDNLVGSYFFDQGNMYYSDSRPRGLRGFSCWFKPTATAAQPAPVRLFLDGIQQDASLSGIGELDFGCESSANICNYADGVYNMNGQLLRQDSSTGNLPKGVYIIKGKKIVID